MQRIELDGGRRIAVATPERKAGRKKRSVVYFLQILDSHGSGTAL